MSNDVSNLVFISPERRRLNNGKRDAMVHLLCMGSVRTHLFREL